MQLAEHTAARLAQSGADVVVIARAGQNLSEYGMRYSHLASRTARRRRRRGLARRAQAQPVRHGARLAVPPGPGRILPRRPLAVRGGDRRARARRCRRSCCRRSPTTRAVARLDTPAYSMVAYPWSQRYQQSNQWAIETLAMRRGAGRDDARAGAGWLQLHGYEPTTLHLSAFKRLGARMTAANVAFDDHPEREAIQRSHRDRHGRLGLSLARARRPRRRVQVVR